MEYNRRYLPADGFKGTELASVGGAIAATSSCCSNPTRSTSRTRCVWLPRTA